MASTRRERDHLIRTITALLSRDCHVATLLAMTSDNERCASCHAPVGEEIKTVQFGWPLGMPLVRKMEAALWEIRIQLDNRAARILFTIERNVMVLLHGFIKKERKTPLKELDVARKRLRQVKSQNEHNGR